MPAQNDQANASGDTDNIDAKSDDMPTAEEVAAIEKAPALEEDEVIAVEEQQANKDAEASETEALEPEEALPTQAQAVLAADPSNYEVSDKNSIEVLAGETLGHYSDWLQIKTSDLRRLNNMSFKKPVVIGQKIKLKFSSITKEKFQNLRVAYHRSLQDTYFAEYQIADTKEHKIQKGDSIWKLAQQDYQVPLWLLLQYNPDLNLSQIKSGDTLVIPLVEEKKNEIN